jgi:hypothetical protein
MPLRYVVMNNGEMKVTESFNILFMFKTKLARVC